MHKIIFILFIVFTYFNFSWNIKLYAAIRDSLHTRKDKKRIEEAISVLETQTNSIRLFLTQLAQDNTLLEQLFVLSNLPEYPATSRIDAANQIVAKNEQTMNHLAMLMHLTINIYKAVGKQSPTFKAALDNKTHSLVQAQIIYKEAFIDAGQAFIHQQALLEQLISRLSSRNEPTAPNRRLVGCATLFYNRIRKIFSY
jgi:hypothetical protein